MTFLGDFIKEVAEIQKNRNVCCLLVCKGHDLSILNIYFRS